MATRRMVAYRLRNQAIADIDVLTAALQRVSPGRVSKADAIAWAVARALAEVAEKAGKPVVAVPPALPEGGWQRTVAVVTEKPATTWGDGAGRSGGNRS